MEKWHTHFSGELKGGNCENTLRNINTLGGRSYRKYFKIEQKIHIAFFNLLNRNPMLQYTRLLQLPNPSKCPIA